ncbi:group III truncated hemoglobin [bacterium]|nr:group III truncated hemoglobin [bacterium]
MQSNEITKENINKLVIAFYTKVMKNEKISPFFIEKLGPDMKSEIWQKHITLLTDFWYTISFGRGNYNGSPFAPHMQISGLDRESFETWLKLFFESLDKLYTEDIALKFKERASIIASNFMRNLAI